MIRSLLLALGILVSVGAGARSVHSRCLGLFDSDQALFNLVTRYSQLKTRIKLAKFLRLSDAEKQSDLLLSQSLASRIAIAAGERERSLMRSSTNEAQRLVYAYQALPKYRTQVRSYQDLNRVQREFIAAELTRWRPEAIAESELASLRLMEESLASREISVRILQSKIEVLEDYLRY